MASLESRISRLEARLSSQVSDDDMDVRVAGRPIEEVRSELAGKIRRNSARAKAFALSASADMTEFERREMIELADDAIANANAFEAQNNTDFDETR